MSGPSNLNQVDGPSGYYAPLQPGARDTFDNANRDGWLRIFKILQMDDDHIEAFGKLSWQEQLAQLDEAIEVFEQVSTASLELRACLTVYFLCDRLAGVPWKR